MARRPHEFANLLAAAEGHAETCQMLLDQGRDVNRWGGESPPLYEACRKGHLKVVKMLLAVDGIEVNIPGRETLNIACLYGHSKVVKMLLAVSGIQVNQMDDDGTTPLIYACQKGHSKVVKMLLAVSGIQVNQADDDRVGCTPLGTACREGHSKVVKMLLAVDGIQVNQANKKGCTPLNTACREGHSKVVKMLLAVDGIQVNQANKEGFTPLMTALNQSHIDIVIQLFQQGIGHNNINEWFRINTCKMSGRIALYKYALLLPQQHQPLLAFHSCVSSAKNALVPTSALKVFRTTWPPLVRFTIESFLLPTKQTRRTMQQVISRFNATLNDHDEHKRTQLYHATCHEGILINKFSRHVTRGQGVDDIVRYRTPLYEAWVREALYKHEKSKMRLIIIPMLREAGGTADYLSSEDWVEQQIPL